MLVAIIAILIGVLFWFGHRADQAVQDCLADGGVPERYGHYGMSVDCYHPQTP